MSFDKEEFKKKWLEMVMAVIILQKRKATDFGNREAEQWKN